MTDHSSPLRIATSENERSESQPSSPGGSPSLSAMTAAAARRRRKEQEEKEMEAIGSGGQENVSVCIRVRPFNRRERELQLTTDNPYQLQSVIKMPKGLDGYLQCMERDPQTSEYKLKQEFQYTKTFWSIPEEQEVADPPQEPITQIDVFRIIGEPIIKYAFAGFNNCVFAYGQTGSGKTHTMTGDFEVMADGEFSEQTGLIPRLCRKLFETIEEKKGHQEEGIVKTFDVQLNAIEIYNEQVRDLFWRSTPGRAKNTVLQVRMHPTEGAFVDQLTILHPKDWRDCIRKIDKGISERTVASTLMNDESSRSHSVFQIIVTQTETVHVRSDDPEDRYTKPVTYKKVSKINLVDLAGSERAKKSGAAGQQLKEASNINQSLFTLKKVIDSLVVNSKEPNPKKHVAIPFRESTLTRLLSDSLGGNSKTTMIACVSPHYDNQEETLLTLQYANRTGAIVNNTRVNEDSAAKQALALKHHILELQKRLAEGPVDEEAEELLDQIEVGRRSLKEMEEENMRAEKEFAEVKSQAKQAEGALYATAVSNTLEMAYSQITKETDDVRLAELLKSLSEAKVDLDILKKRMFEAKRNEESDSKRLDELRMNERAKGEVYASTSEILAALRIEAEKAERRAEKELALSEAQRKANEESAMTMRRKMDEDVLNSHKEHEAKLSRVILKAAEDYELQVRDFADFETSQQHKIARLEEENRTLQRKIDACTKDSVTAMSTITAAAVERSRRLSAIEDEWKQKYEFMRSAYQAQIQKMEEEMVAEDKEMMKKVDELAQKKRQEHLDSTTDLESKIIQVESEWKQRIDAAFNTHGDRIEETIRNLEEESHRKAITTRRDCEEKVRALYDKLERVKYMESKHESALDQLRRVLQTMGAMHDRLVSEAPYDASRELKALKAKLHRFEERMASSPIRVRSLQQQQQQDQQRKKVATAVAGGAYFDPNKDRPLSPHHNGGEAAHINNSTSNVVVDGGVGAASLQVQGLSPYSTVKIFNVFSRERFEEMNAKRFGIGKVDSGMRGLSTATSLNQSSAHTPRRAQPLRAASPVIHNNNNNESTSGSAAVLGVLNSPSGISLLNSPQTAAAASQASLRPSLPVLPIPSTGNDEKTPVRGYRHVPSSEPHASAASPLAANPMLASQPSPFVVNSAASATALSSANNPSSAAVGTPRRIHIPENVQPPKGSLYVRVRLQDSGRVMRSTPVRRL